MNYNIEEYKIEDDLKKLNLKLPNKISFFPENIETANIKEEFIFMEKQARSAVCNIDSYFDSLNHS